MNFLRRLRDSVTEHIEETKRQNELRQAERARQRQEEIRLREQALEAQLEAERREKQRRENILAILHDDKLPEVDSFGYGALPFKFQKTEHLIYVFFDVGYAEQKVKREIVGRSAGTSVRVAKGVYMRAGASRGTPVEKDVIVDRGKGTLAVTSRHLYFSGQRSFRVRFDKIVSVKAWADAVEITRDRASGLSEYFQVGRKGAAFAYELLQAVPSLELPRAPERLDPADYHLPYLQGDVMEHLDEQS